MPTFDLQRVRAQGKQFASGFTPGQKAMTIFGVIAVLAAGFVFTRWSSQPDYTALYTNLSSDDAGSVTQELDASGVAYKISDGGGTIMVARDDVYKTRITLSAKGLPEGGGDSYALLDNAGITTDQFTRNIDYQRALQGELGRTIESIDSIAAATVNITVPSNNVFVGSEEEKSTAAVLVKARGGATISNSTVQAIVHLVSSSIPNMDPAEVTVADSKGAVLHAPGVDNQMGSAAQIEQKTAYETSVAASISDFLAKSLGPNHAAVTVSADLDMSTHETTSVTHEQPGGTTPQSVPKSEITRNETFSGAGAGATGILGPDGLPLASGNQTPTEYTKTETQRDNAVNTTEDRSKQAPGDVERLSVAVLLDSDVVKPADVRKWTEQISAAAGIDAERNDVIEVTTVAFDNEAQKAAAKELASAASAGSKQSMMNLVRQIVALAIVALVLFFAWRAIKRAEATRVPARVPLDLRELEAAVAALPSGGGGNALEAGRAGDQGSLQPARTGVTGDITELIERQPEDVALTLRSWLADRRT